ncbi:hypothetical protein [Fictibacillus phosphorivorans]|uniref:hypothetical protein n=1 Tax=Fictibacillus phosphorivorans TaxID=1221500 RepID=UPI0012937E29|nr:hypothetical protein [Fictibacillus phosphorivorans]MQR97218.1 hypothetical protein [Fictibacillus phosphorivorans]
MCTSFVLHEDQTYVGMNFDLSERPIKMALTGENQLLILQKEGGRFLPAIGFNKKGIFMNLHMVNPNEEGKYKRNKNSIHMMRLFDEVLTEKIKTSVLPIYLEEKEIVNVPDYSVQSLIVGPNQKSFIVEPGRKQIDTHEREDDFMVLTNFSVRDAMEHEDMTLQGPGSDRYQVAFDELANRRGNFSVEQGLSILKQTAQRKGDYPTQLSMIFSPEEESIYFSLKGDFKRLYKFSFSDRMITTVRGFEHDLGFLVKKKGVLLSELEGWG